MIPTEIIGRSHHKHPRLQRQGLVGKRSSPSNKGRPLTAKGGIQPFYIEGVDGFAGASCLQYRLDGLVGSLYHARSPTGKTASPWSRQKSFHTGCTDNA